MSKRIYNLGDNNYLSSNAIIHNKKTLNELLKIKRVKELSIKAGETYTDSDIINSETLIIYYSINANKYVKSLYIQKGDTMWYWDYNAIDYYSIYFMVDWNTGTILVSQYSTINSNVCLLGYDIHF